MHLCQAGDAITPVLPTKRPENAPCFGFSDGKSLVALGIPKPFEFLGLSGPRWAEACALGFVGSPRMRAALAWRAAGKGLVTSAPAEFAGLGGLFLGLLDRTKPVSVKHQ